jgi:hypothetical protein
MKLRAAYSIPVQDRAVCGLKVLDDPSTSTEHEASVLTRDAWVGEHDVAVDLTPHDQLFLLARPVKRKERDYVWAASASESRHRRVRSAAQSRPCTESRRPEVQFTDQTARIEKASLQDLLQPARKCFLAEKPVRVGGTQRASNPRPRTLRTNHDQIVFDNSDYVQSDGAS